MNMTRCKKTLSLIVCVVLLAAAALVTSGCNDNQEPPAVWLYAEETTLGTGDTAFVFTVANGEDNTVTFNIHTDQKTVGEALTELGLLAGEPGMFGLYVKTVNGVTVDYDTDGKYWAFYEDDTYAAAGVDKTAIAPGVTYGFRVE